MFSNLFRYQKKKQPTKTFKQKEQNKSKTYQKQLNNVCRLATFYINFNVKL